MIEIVFTSNKDGESFTGFLPPYATKPQAERVLVRRALSAQTEDELVANVRPAFAADCDEVVALGVFADLDGGSVSGLIDPACGLISAAVSDVWAEVCQHYGRDPDDTAHYVLHASPHNDEGAGRDTGVRVMGDRPSPWRHRLTVPPVRQFPLEEATPIGSPHGWPWRIFRSSVLADAVSYLVDDLENERMGVLHGRLAFAEQSEGLLPYVLYEAFSPLAGASTAASVEIAADAQASRVTLPVAALIHSHPSIGAEEADEVTCPNGNGGRLQGATGISPIDLYELRTGLPHLHQASFIVGLPADPAENAVVTPYGYNSFGSVSAEAGFWTIDDAAGDSSGDALHIVHEGEDSSEIQVKERVQ